LDEIGRRERWSGAALWAGSSHCIGCVGGGLVWSEWARVQCQNGRTRARRGRLGRLGCRAGVARRRTFDAVHRCAGCGAVVGVHASERACRSRRAERALARAEHGLERAPRSAWSAAAGWATWAVCLGVLWRGRGCWLAGEALVSNGRAPVGIGERERDW
jgi:hypothetical protein